MTSTRNTLCERAHCVPSAHCALTRIASTRRAAGKLRLTKTMKTMLQDKEAQRMATRATRKDKQLQKTKQNTPYKIKKKSLNKLRATHKTWQMSTWKFCNDFSSKTKSIAEEAVSFLAVRVSIDYMACIPFRLFLREVVWKKANLLLQEIINQRQRGHHTPLWYSQKRITRLPSYTLQPTRNCNSHERQEN